jgi:hypothetical protein
MAIIPEPARGLQATPLTGRKIQLTWNRSISSDVTEYRIYYTLSSGEIDYGSVQYTVSASTGWWESGQLAEGGEYQFVVRAVNSYENDDGNTNEVVMVSMSSPNTKAKITAIENGMRIYGDKITVMADALTGSISDIDDVTFEYKLKSEESWISIGNDTEYPFVTSWDVEGLTDGSQYNLRAREVDDSTPGYITIIVDSTEPDIEETTLPSGEVRKRSNIYNDIDNVIMVGQSQNNNVTELTIPEGALDVQKTTISITIRLADTLSLPEDLCAASEFRDIVLWGSQTKLNKQATLVIPYIDRNPEDGKVDATGAKEEDLDIYKYISSAGKWRKEQGSTGADAVGKTCTVTTDEFSLFGIFGPMATDVSDAHPYPNPYKPNNPGLGHTEKIKFTELPASVRIRIINMAGDLVFDRQLSKTGGEYIWDATNNAGNPLASGVYFYLITDDNGTKKGKMAIIR